jgi:protoporphyrinogen oxidase
MPELITRLPPEAAVAFKKLKWNSIFNLNLGIKGKILNGQHWIYFPEEKFCFFRIGFPHNFSSYVAPCDANSLYIEVAYSENKPIRKSGIILDIKNDLTKAGIFNHGNIIFAQDTNDIKYGYPVYDINYKSARETAIKFLMHNNIIPCGRFGSWRYLSMEDALLDGKYAAIGI